MFSLLMHSVYCIVAGSFNVKVFDPVNPRGGAIFDYDVGVDCPKKFSLIFHIPTEGADVYEKRYKVDDLSRKGQVLVMSWFVVFVPGLC